MILSDPYGISGAARPWDSLDAMKKPEKVHTCDKQWQIDKCLSCTLDDCHPTICKNGGRTQKKPEIDGDMARRLHAQGYQDPEIARMLCVTEHRIFYWRKKNKLPANRGFWSAKRAMGG